jgi:adenosylcobinamide-phosphate guanylyltransferase
VPVIKTPGAGYVSDLQTAITDDRISLPILTIGADLPLITPAVIDQILQQYSGKSLTVCVPEALKRGLGVSIDEPLNNTTESMVTTGVNIVNDTESAQYLSQNPRLAVNVNRPTDLRVARALV